MVKNAPNALKMRWWIYIIKYLLPEYILTIGKLSYFLQSQNKKKKKNCWKGTDQFLYCLCCRKYLKKSSHQGWKICSKDISQYQHAFLPKHGVHFICHHLETVLRHNLLKRKQHCPIGRYRKSIWSSCFCFKWIKMLWYS